jgi:hypothetical protein
LGVAPIEPDEAETMTVLDARALKTDPRGLEFLKDVLGRDRCLVSRMMPQRPHAEVESIRYIRGKAHAALSRSA